MNIFFLFQGQKGSKGDTGIPGVDGIGLMGEKVRLIIINKILNIFWLCNFSQGQKGEAILVLKEGPPGPRGLPGIPGSAALVDNNQTCTKTCPQGPKGDKVI